MTKTKKQIEKYYGMTITQAQYDTLRLIMESPRRSIKDKIRSANLRLNP